MSKLIDIRNRVIDTLDAKSKSPTGLDADDVNVLVQLLRLEQKLPGEEALDEALTPELTRAAIDALREQRR